jgi:hypothetical protein
VPVVCEDLVKALRRESEQAVAHWWGVGVWQVWRWRRVLGVPRVTDGTSRLYHEHALSSAAAASGFLLTQSTYVVVPPGAQVGAVAWKEVFRRALIREGVTWPRAVCRSIRANWCKPWDRAQAELTAALGAKAKGRRPIPKSRESDAPRTAAEFEDWWQLIAHPDHVAHEVKELPAAWQGALEQAPGVATAMGGNPDALRFHRSTGRFCSRCSRQGCGTWGGAGRATSCCAGDTGCGACNCEAGALSWRALEIPPSLGDGLPG